MSDFEAINRALGRIEGKLDGVVERLRCGAVRMDKLELRVSDSEKRVWRMAGAAGVVAAVGVLVIGSVFV